MNWSLIWAIIGTAASVLSLIFAVIQTLKYRAEKENYKKLKRIQHNQIWGNIRLVLETFDRLEPLKENAERLNSVPDDVKSRIIAARQSAVDNYIRLIEQAALAEDNFTQETVDKWFENKKLENDWRRQVAMMFVQTDCLKNKETDCIE